MYVALAALAVSHAADVLPTDPSDGLFVPDDHVPLSAFVSSDSVPIGEPLSFAVQPDILAWLDATGAEVLVAADLAAGVSYLAPTSVDPVAGLVTLDTALLGTFAVVSGALTNDFPVVTHWNQALNEGRGGQQIGASDALGLFDLDPDTGELVDIGVSLRNFDDAHLNPDHPELGPYHFATDLYAVFSDGTELTPEKDGDPADADTPDYERYVGENYATNGVTDLAAIWLSDTIREATGYPIVHRNHPWAFDGGAPDDQQVRSGVPAFQVVHAHLVDNQDPSVPGSESSLATFLLPPDWTARPDRRYPILFNGFYDIHASTFGVMGTSFLETLGALVNTRDRRAVGVLWNGGGAGACQTMHRSAYDNAALLFRTAKVRLATDPHRVVISGGSRGGTTGLEMAANPYHRSYTARFVIARDPQVRPGQAIEVFNNATYRLIQDATNEVVGYQNAWQKGWVDPDTGWTAGETAMYHLLGSIDGDFVDDNLANNAPAYLNALSRKGTQVILRVGTHDFSKPFSQLAEYADSLRAASVPVRFEINYRFGHAPPLGMLPDAEALLNQVFENDPALETGTFHFKPLSAEEYDVAVPFTPDHPPMVLEAPIIVGAGQTATFTVVGQPGAAYEIEAQQVLDFDWFPDGDPPLSGVPFPLFGGTLPDVPGVELTSAVHELTVPDEFPLIDFYWFELGYGVDGGAISQFVSTGATAPPLLPPHPIVTLWSEEVIGLDDQSRTGGLSADALFEAD